MLHIKQLTLLSQRDITRAVKSSEKKSCERWIEKISHFRRMMLSSYIPVDNGYLPPKNGGNPRPKTAPISPSNWKKKRQKICFCVYDSLFSNEYTQHECKIWNINVHTDYFCEEV